MPAKKKVTEEVKAVEEKAAKAAKATATKTKTTARKAAKDVKTEVEKVEKKVKVPAKKPANEVIIQSPMGGVITPAEVLKKVGPVDQVYVRIDENKLYWVKGDETGSVDIW